VPENRNGFHEALFRVDVREVDAGRMTF
jgi:hypothetical protein